MSRQVALDNIHLRPASHWAHTEYSLNYHDAFVRQATGAADGQPIRYDRMHEVFQIDFCWSTWNALPVPGKQGRRTDMGHAAYAADSSDFTRPHASPFTEPEEVWAFDAVEEYGLPDFDAQVRAFQEACDWARQSCPDQLSTGGYYETLVSGAIAAFGWDMLLLAAADARQMEKVLDSFFRRTLFLMQAQARTDVEAVIQHDDFVWTNGAFLHPDFYRRAIIPRYAELWKPLHAAGKKVLFCSDGNFMEFAEDVAAAGADGFIFEPCNDFGAMADKFGQSHCLVGSYVDCRDLTLGHWDRVQADIDRTVQTLQRKCRGGIFAVGNHLAPNIPPAMLRRYFAYLLPRLARS
jgi:hypothetical protein